MPGTHLYSDPEIYDILHAPGTADEVRTLADVHRRFASGSPKVALEPACGSGRYCPGLLRRGFEVHGFDADPGMVRYAKKAAAKTIIRVGRFDTFSTTGLVRRGAGRVGLAFCPINSIRHVASDAEMVRHLKRVKSCLHPQGVYVVGISLSAYGLEMPTEDIWTGSRRGVRVKQVVSFIPAPGDRTARERAEQVHSVLEIRTGRKIETRSSSYSLLSYSREQWEAVIRRSGLRVIARTQEQGRVYDPGAIGYALWVLGRGTRG
jgi:SAM-dependent methyltransferase